MFSMADPPVDRAAYCTRRETSVPVSWETVHPVAAAMRRISVALGTRRPEMIRLSVDCEIPVASCSAR